MAEEWVEHSLDITRKAKTKVEAAERAHTEVGKKLKDTLAQLVEVERGQKNAKLALKSFEK